ncbi:MAG: ATP-binding cassette domain-containing protein [Deltaproteobacteria bacterium]|jgi:ATP-binding cassette, subfamily B, bacterial|nr:ATP-binding cassette domain-containing protein [Deltaproteobacteria bacterium]MBT7203983.1 ATP-binding cassette domain-containing protein [Deltaproteobacteria bacterium]
MLDTSSRAKSKQLSNFLPAFCFLRPYKWRILLAGIALVTTAGVSLSLGQGVRLLIDQGFVAGSPEALTQTLLLFLVLVTLLALGTFLRFYLVSWLGERVSADLRKAVFQHLLQLHPGFFETNLSGEIQARITADTTVLQTVIGSSLSVALRNVLLFLGGIGWLFWTNPKLTTIVLIAVPLLVSPVVIFGRRVRRLSRTSQDKVASVGAYVGEALQHIKIVQGMNHQRVDEKSFSQHVESAFDAGIQRIRQRAFLIAIVMLLVLGSIGGMLWVGGQDVLAGRVTPGELAAFVFYALIVASSLGFLSEVIGDLQRAAGATERLIELLEAESEITDPVYPQPLPSLVRGSVEINDLHFCYPSRPDSLTLQAVNLNIEPGMTMALVGPSGAGKSTFLELLLRFYDPLQGSITFEGIDLRSLTLQELRRHIAFVPQQPTLFSTNVWGNLRYGQPKASKEEMLAATRDANAEEFLNKLPQGFDSFLGEQGVRLSGGQRQRLAIARAILRDPKLLLLDEATSALDAESERMVQEALLRLMQERTTIVIAHRLATVIHADQIAVMDQGQVVALGTHQQLLDTSPLYSRLAELQFHQETIQAA